MMRFPAFHDPGIGVKHPPRTQEMLGGGKIVAVGLRYFASGMALVSAGGRRENDPLLG
jgi:hypothetical protein